MDLFFKIVTDTIKPSTSNDIKLTTTTLSKKFSLTNRLAYYKPIHKYITSQTKYDPNNCFKFNNDIISIGNGIILDKRIGDNSKYGAVFLSHFKHPNGKISTFVTKVVDSSKRYNIIEAEVLKRLTELNVKYKVCPHFPICYGVLQCDNYFKEQNKLMLENLYYKKLLFTFNELEDNSLKQLLASKQYTTKIILNAIAQLFMAIMFFNKYIQAFHTDTHYGNLLYHKTKPGGYFHYKINDEDYYIENIGYMWIIWDFGLIVPYKKISYPKSEAFIYSKKVAINFDYIKTLANFIKFSKLNLGDINIMFKIISNKYNNIYDVKKMPILINDILELLIKYTDGNFLTSLPANSKIINRIPYKL